MCASLSVLSLSGPGLYRLSIPQTWSSDQRGSSRPHRSEIGVYLLGLVDNAHARRSRANLLKPALAARNVDILPWRSKPPIRKLRPRFASPYPCWRGHSADARPRLRASMASQVWAVCELRCRLMADEGGVRPSGTAGAVKNLHSESMHPWKVEFLGGMMVDGACMSGPLDVIRTRRNRP